MTLKLPKIPKVKIPFLSSSDRNGEEGDFQDEFEDFDDREPEGARKWLPWVAVGLAYLVVIGGVGGAVYYLSSQADDIRSEMMALRPSMVVEPLPGAPDMAMEAEQPGDAGDDAAAQPSTTEDAAAALAKAAAGAGDSQEPATEETAALQLEAFQSLQPHPNPNLIEETAVGPLPKIADDGRMPWRVYARPFNSLDKRPKVAIVVTDLGLHDALTEEAVDLPGAMSLAFAPYARGLSEWIQKSRDAGHEVLLTLPMEPYDFPRSDPGPYALMTSYGPEENIKKLNWILSRATGYVGLVNFQGSRFNSSADLLEPVLAHLAGRGLLYLDSGETPITVTRLVAEERDAPVAVADITLDNPPDRASIVAQLARLEARARADGVAVGVAHPFPATMSRLRVWSRELAAKGIALIPLSAVIAGEFRTAGSG